MAKVYNLLLGLVEPHTFGPSPSIQPVQILLRSPPTLEQINTPTHLGDTCKFTNGTISPLIQIINKVIKQDIYTQES